MNEDAYNDFPRSADAVVATLTELFRLQKNHKACEILENAKANIEETGYDGIDGGQYYFTLYLDIPLNLFARVETDVGQLEKLIAKKFSTVFRDTGNMWLTKAVIRPVIEEPKATNAPKIKPVDIEHLWKPGMIRVFLSHISAEKVGVSKLKLALQKWGVDSFVAHEDIEPNMEWQKEIELALRSMHALVALLTLGFHESKWTDQEIGFAIGKGILVIPVRLGIDPYGFIGKQQGLPGKLDAQEALATNIVDLLLKHKTTDGKMREALVLSFEKTKSFDTAMNLLPGLKPGVSGPLV
jgi:hypothetical protein